MRALERWIWKWVGRETNTCIHGVQWIIAFLFHPVKSFFFWIGQNKSFHYSFATNAVTILGMQIDLSMVPYLNKMPVGSHITFVKNTYGTWMFGGVL